MSGATDVTYLEGKRRRGKGRSVIVQIQHLDLKLANGFLGRPAVIFDWHSQTIESPFLMIQRDFGPNGSRWLVNTESFQSVSVVS